MLYVINEELLKKRFADIAFVADRLSVYEVYKVIVFQRFSVIHVSRCNHEVEQFPLLVADQMTFDPGEPTKGALTPLGYALDTLWI